MSIEQITTEERDLLEFIQGKNRFLGRGVNSYPFSMADTNRLRHAACLSLEAKGLIYRQSEAKTKIFWRAATESWLLAAGTAEDAYDPVRQIESFGLTSEDYKKEREGEFNLMAETNVDCCLAWALMAPRFAWLPSPDDPEMMHEPHVASESRYRDKRVLVAHCPFCGFDVRDVKIAKWQLEELQKADRTGKEQRYTDGTIKYD